MSNNDPFKELWSKPNQSIHTADNIIKPESYPITGDYIEANGKFICLKCNKIYKHKNTMLSHIDNNHR